MKKLIALTLALCMSISLFAACGSDEPQASSNPSASSTAENISVETTEPTDTTEPVGIETDENLLTVEITLPASMLEGEDMNTFDPDAYAAENGFLKAVVNDDGSMTITMTKAKHTALLEEMKLSLDESFAAFVEAADTPYIKEITHNDDFSSVAIKVVRADYENAWDFTAFSVGVSAMFYQAFLDMEYHVEVSVIDVETGEAINTTIFPDALG